MSDEREITPESAVEIEAHLAGQVQRQVARTTDGLRRLADRLDNTARREQTKVITRPAGFAHDIMHELQWGIANLPTDTLLASVDELTFFQRGCAAKGLLS